MAKRGILEHPKTIDLADRLGIMDCFAVGILEALWQWCQKYAITGLITTRPTLIARGIRYTGDAEELITHLVEVGWLDKLNDGRLVIHDVRDHADNTWRQCLQDAGLTWWDGSSPRKSSSKTQATGAQEETEVKEDLGQTQETLKKNSSKTPEVLKESSSKTQELFQENSSKSPQPEPEPETISNLASEAADLEFLEFWRFYPKRSGDSKRKIALIRFKNARKRVSFELIMEGVKRYSRFCDSTGKTGTELVQQASTWLSGEAWNEIFEYSEEPPANPKPVQGVDFYTVDGGWIWRNLETQEEVSEAYASANPNTTGKYKRKPRRYVIDSDPPREFDEGEWLRDRKRAGEG